MAVIGPLAGVVVDRVNRRRLMIAADVARGFLILGLLFVRTADQVWIAYVVMGLTVAATAFFEPARTATIPNITSEEELLPANALSAATWSAMLAAGASIGGLVTAIAGRNIAFGINAASFFWSAFFIGRTRYDATPPVVVRPAGIAALTGFSDLVEGFRYIRHESHVAALMCVKAGWGLAGGVLLLLTISGSGCFRSRAGPLPASACCTARAESAPPSGRSRSAGFSVNSRAHSGERSGRPFLSSASSTWLWLERRRWRSRRFASSALISVDRSSGCSAQCSCSSKFRIASAAGCSRPSSRW